MTNNWKEIASIHSDFILSDEAINFIQTEIINKIIDDLESNPIAPKNATDYSLQYWIEQKQMQLRQKWGGGRE